MESRRPRLLSPAPAADVRDDRALVEAAATGDAAAFRELYRRHVPTVHARLTLMVGPGPEREDLIQQIFLDAYRALARFRGDARFGTFLHRIAINVACDHLQARRRSGARDAPLDEAQLDRLVAPGASPESRASQRQDLAQAFAHLRRSARRSGSPSCWSPSRGCRWTRRPSCSTRAPRR